nr:protein longifolia 1 [Ipomoea batatas]
MHSAAQKLLGGARVTVDSSIQKDVETSSSQDSFWCNPENIAAMDAAILRREEYLRKVADMPSFSLGLTPPLGEEANRDNVFNISSQYQDVGAEFPQACSPSSEHQKEEQREVCEKDAALEERGGGVEIVGEKDVVVEERVDRVEMVVEKDSALEERGGGVDIFGEKDVVVDESVDAVDMVCEKDAVVDERGGGGAESEERVDVQLWEESMLDKGKGIIVDDGGKAPEIQTVENQKGERRSRKITVPLRSPYMVRQINVGQFLTATEKEVNDASEPKNKSYVPEIAKERDKRASNKTETPPKSPLPLPIFEVKDGERSFLEDQKEAPRLSLEKPSHSDAKGKPHPKETQKLMLRRLHRKLSCEDLHRSREFQETCFNVTSSGENRFEFNEPNYLQSNIPNCIMTENVEIDCRRSMLNARHRGQLESGLGIEKSERPRSSKTRFKLNIMGKSPQHRKCFYDTADIFPEPTQMSHTMERSKKRFRIRGLDEPS